MRATRIREHLTDLALWAVLAGSVALTSDPNDGGSWWQVGVGVLLTGVAVLLCRTWPLASLCVVVALGARQSLELLTPSYAVAMAAFGYLAGRRTATARPALITFTGITAAGLALSLLLSDLWTWFAQLATLLFAVVVPWLLGRYVRQYAQLVATGWQLADRMEREQQAVADRERLRERSRIAGDMHDSLGHELSLIAVRAAALEVDPGLDERRQAAAGELRRAAADATARLRDIIGVLRAEEAAPTAPVGETVTVLVDRARDSGMTVDFTHEGAPTALPPMTDRAVHRVVQESLTNAAKHAPGAAVRVRIVHDAAAVLVSVSNPPGRPGPFLPSGGTGLVGLDERVRLAGGTLTHGRADDGGFAVHARLPLTAEAVTPSAPASPASARELDLARRRVRRGLVQAIAVPVTVAAVLGILILAFRMYSETRTVMDREQYDRIRVGDPRADVLTRLPRLSLDGAPAGVDPEPPDAGDCEYYRALTHESSPAYRLCFKDGRLASKAIVTDVDNEENRPR